MQAKVLFCLAAFWPVVINAAPERASVDDEVYDLKAVEVTETIRTLEPDFKMEVPRFTHFERPKLPNGDLILALSFIDRYEQAETPDQLKWAGILTIPAVDGIGRHFLKRVCLFYYDKKLFGWDPGAPEQFQRFETNLEAADLHRPEALYNFASHYLEKILPRHSEWIMVSNLNEIGLADGYNFRDPLPIRTAEEQSELLDIPQRVLYEMDAARVAPLPGMRNVHPHDLVKITYFFMEHPNRRMGNDPIYGPEPTLESTFDLSDLIGDVRPGEDQCYRTAKELLAGRWCQRARLINQQQILLIAKVPSYEKVLLFAMNQKIFAYHPELGIWDGELTLADLQSGNVAGKFAFPGKAPVSDIKLLDW